MSRAPTDRATRQCGGCDLWYTTTGIVHHLEQTQRPACIAYQEQVEAEGYQSSQSSTSTGSGKGPGTPSTLSSSSRSPSPPPLPAMNNDHDLDLPPQPFAGDFYGDYDAADWDDFDEYQGNDADAGDDEDPEDDEEDEEDDRREVEDGEEEDADNYEDEGGWEPPFQPPLGGPRSVTVEDEEDLPEEVYGNAFTRQRAHEQLRVNTYIDPFPNQHAGQPTSEQRESSAYERYQSAVDPAGDNPYAPFSSRIDYEVAKWAKMRGPGSTALSELLQIEELVMLLGLSFKNSQELNNIIDNELSSGRPRFIRRKAEHGSTRGLSGPGPTG